jgi:hypothetical protein
MMARQWAPEPLPQELADDREIYRRALDVIRTIPTPSQAAGQAYLRYWTARLEFAVTYFDAIEAVKRAATAEKAAEQARQDGDEGLYRMRLAEAVRYAQDARDTAFAAIDTYAAVAKNRADAGAVATLSEYAWRHLGRKVEELQQAAQPANGK